MSETLLSHSLLLSLFLLLNYSVLFLTPLVNLGKGVGSSRRWGEMNKEGFGRMKEVVGERGVDC